MTPCAETEQSIQAFEAKIVSGEIKDVLKETLEEFKETICVIIPSMMEANIISILQSIKDPTCLALCPQTEQVKGLLEELVPTKEVPSSSSIIDEIEEAETFTDQQKDLIGELFDTLEMAYDHTARVCGILGVLSYSLNSHQLLILLKSSIRPLIQVNAIP